MNLNSKNRLLEKSPISETKKQRTANTGFASGGLKCKLGALCFYSSVVLADSFMLRNPPERQAPNR